MVERDYHGDSLKISFKYWNQPEGASEDVYSIITLEFTGAREYELRMTEDWVNALDLEETEEGVTASWSKQRLGLHSKVDATEMKCSIRVIQRQD